MVAARPVIPQVPPSQLGQLPLPRYPRRQAAQSARGESLCKVSARARQLLSRSSRTGGELLLASAGGGALAIALKCLRKSFSKQVNLAAHLCWRW